MEMNAVKNYTQLLAEYAERKESANEEPQNSLVKFIGIGEGKDAYNPSGPFSRDGKTYQWARVESREQQDAVTMLFEETGANEFTLVPDSPILPMEDPFISFVGEEMLVGGVEISKDENGMVISYRTIFYRGASFDTLTLFALGPDGMKDIRICDLGNVGDRSHVFVFTRPHIPLHGRFIGRIAVTTLTSLDEIHADRLAVEHTEVLSDLFADDEWGGVNDAYVLGDGLIGALCHIAKYDEEGKRHYAAAAFVIDTATMNHSPLEIIATRADFPDGPIKIMPDNLGNPEMYDDLADVIFSSRLTIPPTPLPHSVGVSESSNSNFAASSNPNSAAKSDDISSAPILQLTCGLSDAAVGVCIISNPFLRLIKALKS
jgi:hypothetical protein